MKEAFYRYLSEKAMVHPEHLSALVDAVTEREFKKGEMLLRLGQICEHTFFIEQGLTRLYSISEDGVEHILQFAPENWFISERSSVYFHQASMLFIDAIEDSKVVLLDRDFIEMATALSQEFRTYNEYILQNHIRHLQNRIHLLIGSDARSRYLDFIRLYPDLSLRVPQWMIASYLGITPESLSRVRKELARQNYQP